jgi:hypothetical protein
MLEQREVTDKQQLERYFKDCMAASREEGRREVLREIARLPHTRHEGIISEVGLCAFCVEPVTQMSDHAPDCLWLRASQVLQ